MKQKFLFPLTVSASIGLHVVLFFLLSVKTSGPLRLPAEDKAAEWFSLINIALLEPAVPPPPLERPPVPLPSPVLPLSDPIPAENYIVQDNEQDKSSNEQGAAAEEAAAFPAAFVPERGTENSARTAEYVKRSLNYIQRLIKNKLVYPPPARKAGVQGVAEVSFTIHKGGEVSDVKIRTSSGHGILDEAALAAVFAAAPFPPPPAAARVAIPISFRLR
jgi:protein TonB